MLEIKPQIVVYPFHTAPTDLHKPVFTFNSEPSSGAHPFSWEDDGARVLQGEVGQGEAVDQPVGADPPVVVRLHPDAVFLPDALHICVGELHLEGGRLSLKGFLVG